MRGRSSKRAQPSREHIANDDLADLAELYRVLGRATVRVLCGDKGAPHHRHQAAADGAGRAGGGDQGGSRLTPAQAQALQTVLRRSAQ